MNRVRLLPIVVLAIASLLVLKTVGLATNGGYLFAGVSPAMAAGGGGGHGGGGGDGAGTTEADATVTPVEPTLEDTTPTISDSAPTLGEEPAAAGGHGAPAAGHGEAAPAGDHGSEAAEGEHGTEAEAAADGHGAPAEGAAPAPMVATVPGAHCVEADATLTETGETILHGAAAEGGHGAAPAAEGHGEEPAAAEGHGEEPAAEGHGEEAAVEVPAGSFAATMIDCLPSGDAVPTQIGPDGQPVAISAVEAASSSEQQLLQRLVDRRTELEKYEADLALRASLVDAAEKRIEERAATLEALETQISTLVDQRQQMEAGQFASIVAMYENMRPKDAANIFNNLDMAVLLQVAKTMSPRKMAPIMAAMDAARAQELTVQMADLAERPPTEMTPEDLAALPQIVGN
ncbi:MAG TPA: hypothetical protein VIL88_04095 [Devosia sp.]|uniref:MotE family protein n=1 Tax=Devosia sp. TaxID=1871048 RepID=UPI002F94AD99